MKCGRAPLLTNCQSAIRGVQKDITAGQAHFMAARQLGMNDVPVILQHQSSEALKRSGGHL